MSRIKDISPAEPVEKYVPKPPKPPNYRPCDICVSPWRGQIESAIDAHMLRKDICAKYMQYFPGCNVPVSFLQKINIHIKHRSRAANIMSFAASGGVGNPSESRASLESLAQKLLVLGDKAVDLMMNDPSKVDMKDVLTAQKLLIDKKKVRVQEDALKLGMAKFLGGFEDPDIEEGEVIDESKISILPEST